MFDPTEKVYETLVYPISLVIHPYYVVVHSNTNLFALFGRSPSIISKVSISNAPNVITIYSMKMWWWMITEK